MVGRKRWTSNCPCGWTSRSRLTVAVVREWTVGQSKKGSWWEGKLGDGVPIVKAFHIRPVLVGLRRPGIWDRRTDIGHLAMEVPSCDCCRTLEGRRSTAQ